MDPIQGSEAIQQFINLLNENGREGQAQDLSQLMWYMDGMDRQFNAILQELQEVKQQLAQARMFPRKSALSRMVNTLEGKVQQVRTCLDNLREKIVKCAVNAVQGFKQMGAAALDKAVSALGVKKALKNLQEDIGGTAADMKKSIEKVERLGHELRSAGGHLKNIGRAMAGKDVQAVDGGREGRFQAVLLAPMRVTYQMLARMNNATLATIGKVERLEQTAENAREIRAAKRPSVRKDLESKKAEAAVRAARSAPEKEFKPKEAAL